MQPPFHTQLAILASTISILILNISISPGNSSYFELHIFVVNVTYSNSYRYRRHQTFIAFFTWVHEERWEKKLVGMSTCTFSFSLRWDIRPQQEFICSFYMLLCIVYAFTWMLNFGIFCICIFLYRYIIWPRYALNQGPWSSSYCDIKIKMNVYNFACAIVLAYLLNWQTLPA